MGTLADLRQKTVDVGSSWIVERIYGIGKSELPVVEGFDQESVALERMGQLIMEAAGKHFGETELERMLREGGFYTQDFKVKMESRQRYRQLYDLS
jgi:hypothetical protein